jgi:SpoVK/Ycf46/Vps4 family AAA+-type ATPase
MERFRGIFICTTNLMERIDQAALRRFTFKIQFLPLTLVQRRTLFLDEACAGDPANLSPALERRLAALDQLCLGDFAAVRRQTAILDARLEPDEFLEQLEAEHRIKPEVREGRSMGFLQ